MRLAGSALYVLVAQVAPKISTTLLFIVLARTAGISQAGAYSLAATFLSIAVSLSAFGLEEVAVREVAPDPARARHYFVNLAIMRALLGLLAFIVLVGSLATVFTYPPEVEGIIILLAASLIPEGISDLVQALFVATGRVRWTAIVSASVAGLQLVVGAAVVLLDGRLSALILVIIAHSYLACLLNLLLGMRLAAPGDASTRLDLGLWRRQIRLAPPFVLLSVFTIFEAQADIVILSLFRPIGEVGIYGAAKTVLASATLFSQAFRVAAYPLLAQLQAGPVGVLVAAYNRLFRYLLLISLPAGAALVALGPWLVQMLYTPQFEPAVLPLQMLAVTLVVGFLYIPSTRLMVASRRERQLTVLVGITAAVNALANLLLAALAGANGAGAARALSSLLYFALCQWFVSNRMLSLRTGGVLLAGVLAALPMLLLPALAPAALAPAGLAAGMVIYLVLAWRFGLLDPKEIDRAWDRLRILRRLYPHH